jgi:His/Glu/Gln/Arg/opine family amino acid ABC transporter permease subunit
MEGFVSVKFLGHVAYFGRALVSAAAITVEVTVGALAMAVVLGLVFAAVKVSRLPGARLAIDAYVEVFRGIPALTQLFIIYFGLTYVGIRLNPIPAAILGLGLIGAAYCTEIFRSGFGALHHGQREAALAAGMTPAMAMRYVIIPQAWRIVLPPLGNYAIGLLKDTAVCSAIAAPEILYRARNLATETFETPIIYFVAAGIYFALTFPLARTVEALERKRRSWQ